MTKTRTPWCREGAATGAVLLATMLAACGGEGGPGGTAGPSVRDSAGISIVENRIPTWAAGEAWMVDAEPALSVGTLDGPPETQFFDLSAVRLRSDGSLVAAEEGGRRIRAFGPAGDFLWSQGRDGDGPGEYRRNHGDVGQVRAPVPRVIRHHHVASLQLRRFDDPPASPGLCREVPRHSPSRPSGQLHDHQGPDRAHRAGPGLRLPHRRRPAGHRGPLPLHDHLLARCRGRRLH